MTLYDYPSDWRSRRDEVLSRARYVCQFCGEKGGEKGDAELVVHHFIPRELGGTHETSNLICLCSNCKSIFKDDTGGRGGNNSVGDDSSADYHIGSMSEFIEAVGHVETVDDAVTVCASHVFGDAEVGEGALVREADEFHIQARDVKRELVVLHALFSDQRLSFESPAVERAHDRLDEEVFDLLSVFLDIVIKFEEYLDLLTSTRCPECGNYDHYTQRLCSECSREMPVVWECLQCRTHIDELSQDYCRECGNELAIFPPQQREQIDQKREETVAVVRQWRDQSETFMDVVKNTVVPAHRKARA